MNELRQELAEVRAALSAAEAAHHACWYDAGGVQGVYVCPECGEEKWLREKEKAILAKLNHDDPSVRQ